MSTSKDVQSPNVAEILAGLSRKEDATRKMAAFKLQNLINDPSFAEYFVAQGGQPRLRDVILESSGNTLAYSLSSFSRLLDMDQGWEGVDGEVVEKAVELVVNQPLVNILRGAMSVLVAIVSRPHHIEQDDSQSSYLGGFTALKPAVAHYPLFLEMLVSRLTSADHALCANALQLINALMRDAMTVEDEAEWPMFIKRITELGVIKAVYTLMQSSALQDLALPLLEFQQLTRVLLGRRRDVAVDLAKTEQRRTIKAIHLSSDPPDKEHLQDERGLEAKPKHDPYKWRRLGFASEVPELDFEDMGFLGMMDLSDYVRKHTEEFRNILAEQALQPPEKRCPLAQASLAMTAVLFEHFEIDKVHEQEQNAYVILESRTNYETVFKPLLFHWSRLHVAALHAFFRLWKDTGAETDDLLRIVELVRILVESVVGGAERTKTVETIEQELASYQLKKLRELQMELLDLTYRDMWGPLLRGAKEELQAEALHFVKEQRIRCLLEGTWFPDEEPRDDQRGPVEEVAPEHPGGPAVKFIRLSPDRRYLHFGNFDGPEGGLPTVGSMASRIDLSTVSSVVSNITASEDPTQLSPKTADGVATDRFTTTKITIHGHEPRPRQATATHSRKAHHRTGSKSSSRPGPKEVVLLTFQPPNHTVASEWLDGLLMLLDQQPITAETNRLIRQTSEMGMMIRLLNVRFNDEDGLFGALDGIEPPPVPSREGLDEDYYYEI